MQKTGGVRDRASVVLQRTGGALDRTCVAFQRTGCILERNDGALARTCGLGGSWGRGRGVRGVTAAGRPEHENLCAPGTMRIPEFDISVDTLVIRRVQQYCASTP